MTYTTGGINIHNNAKGAVKFARLGLDQTVFNESSRIQPDLRALNGRRVTNLTDPGPDRRRKSLWANTILTRDKFPSAGSICLQAADPATPYKLAPARTIVAEIARIPGDIGLVARGVLHSHVIGQMNDNPDEDRVVGAEEYAQVLDDVLSILERRADHLVFSGDINLRKGAATPGWDSVYEVVARHKLRIKMVTAIDALIYSPSLKLITFDVLPKTRFGTDHDGFRAQLGVS